MTSRRDDLSAAERRWRDRPLFDRPRRNAGRRVWILALVGLAAGGWIYLHLALSDTGDRKLGALAGMRPVAVDPRGTKR